MNNVPVDLYFLLRRVSDQADPKDILKDEVNNKYGKVDRKELFQNFSRLASRLNPDDYDSSTAKNIRTEKELIDDKDSPTTTEEADKIRRFGNYVNQKHFFKGSRSGERGIQGGPSRISDEDIDRLRSMDSSDPDLDYFNDLGKHLYVHHGWCLGDFQAHPTNEDREIAHELEHNPVMGTIQSAGTTYFDELAQPFAKGTRTPVLGKPAPNMLKAHMRLLHGYPGTEEDHKRDHINGTVTNHTHDASDFD